MELTNKDCFEKLIEKDLEYESFLDCLKDNGGEKAFNILIEIRKQSIENLEKMILEESESIHNFLENPQMKGIWSEISVKQDVDFYMKSFDLDNKGEGIYDMLIEQNNTDGN